MDRADRFMAKVARSDGCWTWTGARNRGKHGGYGRFMWKPGQVVNAHRAAWLLFVGAIPDGLEVCHSCDNRACVNPAHLMIGRHTANVSDMVAKGRHGSSRKTHCPAGHPYAGDNLIIDSKGSRVCRTCQLAAQRRWRTTQRPTVTRRGPGATACRHGHAMEGDNVAWRRQPNGYLARTCAQCERDKNARQRARRRMLKHSQPPQ